MMLLIELYVRKGDYQAATKTAKRSIIADSDYKNRTPKLNLLLEHLQSQAPLDQILDDITAYKALIET
jgi:hypothetical protein